MSFLVHDLSMGIIAQVTGWRKKCLDTNRLTLRIKSQGHEDQPTAGAKEEQASGSVQRR